MLVELKRPSVKAYILSTTNGTVQIGDTIFQPCTGAQFKADRPRKGEYIAILEVKDKSMDSAREALSKHAEQHALTAEIIKGGNKA